MQSDTHGLHNGLHVAMIMDGNGRWATRQGLPRSAGHRAGVVALRQVIEQAPELGVATLTVFAFSSDNWRRPVEEVNSLMWLLRGFLRSEVDRFVAHDVRLTMIGRRDRLPMRLTREITHAERVTAHGQRLHVRVALDYSARAAILRAAARLAGKPCTAETFEQLISPDAAPVDLMIRTGGEQRLSDFMLWECAYAELWFTPQMWPDFTPADLAQAISAFHGRERRFGGLGANAPAPVASMPLAGD
jgi:undecaprenyl diphosphate synthase